MRKTKLKVWSLRGAGLAALALAMAAASPFHAADAAIPGVKGPIFNLAAEPGFISTPDGGVTYMWLWHHTGGSDTGQPSAQYPGPTLIVDWAPNTTVTINVSNNLTNEPAAMPIGLNAPGLNIYCAPASAACADGDVDPGETATFQFVIKRPGTFSYYSDYRTDLGVAMGLVGTIIIRPNNFAHVAPDAPVPAGGATQKAYGSNQTVYDNEYLIQVTEVDDDYHRIVRGEGLQDWENCINLGQTTCVDQTQRITALTEQLRNVQQTSPGGRLIKGFFPEYWFVNGRAAFDNFQGSHLPWMPTQPYDGISLSHPGETSLVRFVSAGRQIHPFHPHGDEVAILAVDSRLLHAGAGNTVGGAPGGAAPNLQYREYTIDQAPGQTVDVTWNWMPKGLGFDVYGNDASAYAGLACPPGDPDESFVPFVHDPLCIVDAADRGKPLPTSIPPLSDLVFGGFWSGTAFLGKLGTLPPGEGGLNPVGALAMIWHSHREKELLNKSIFPGGMLSAHLVVPYTFEGGPVTIPRGACFDSNNGRGC